MAKRKPLHHPQQQQPHPNDSSRSIKHSKPPTNKHKMHTSSRFEAAVATTDFDNVFAETWSRGRWLLVLLALQSVSSVVLDHYEALLRRHMVVTLFLTMLVGAGGNAGNQSAIKVIRGLATGALKPTWASFRQAMLQQATVAFLLALMLGGAGLLRVYYTKGGLLDAVAIAIALVAIVATSILLGTALPYALAAAGVDPANAGTVIQVCFIYLSIYLFLSPYLATGGTRWLWTYWASSLRASRAPLSSTHSRET